MIKIPAIHIGQPQTISDEQGDWRSSISRRPLSGPVELGLRGLAGDRVTDTKHHGTPDQAVCCHLLEHYHERMTLSQASWSGCSRYALPAA